MAVFKSFEEIEARQQARELTKLVCAASGTGTFERDFGLRDQVRTASVSIMSNTAEDNGRGGNKEFIQFLSVARGSAGEVNARLCVALDQGYVTQEEFERLREKAVRTGSVISGLIRYRQSAKLQGSELR